MINIILGSVFGGAGAFFPFMLLNNDDEDNSDEV